MYKTIFTETLKGKTLSRTLQNLALSQFEISGDVIDLGSKSKKSSYYRFIKIKSGTNLVFADLYSTKDAMIKIDLEKSFPIQDEAKNFILLNNVLEHLFYYQICIEECFRILKRGGCLIGVVPFIHRIHPDPDDYFRYTKSSLEKLFYEAGFQSVKIKSLGFGPVSAGLEQFACIAKIKIIIALAYIVAIFIDKLLNKIFKNNNAVRPDNFPLCYLFICKK